jgi:probable HAF family extracellular repeat protein
MPHRCAPWLLAGWLVGTSLLLWTVVAGADPPVQYLITDLGPSQVFNIAPTATTVVGSQLAPNQTAFVLYPTTTDLGFLPQGGFSRANGAYGQAVVGYSSTGPFGLYTHAFRWTAATGMQDLGTAGAIDLFSAATALNAAGTMVGYAERPDRGGIVPVMWVGGQITILPTLSAGHAYAEALNDVGDSVGDATTASGEIHAVLWPASGGVIDLHTVSGPFSLALSVNNVGQVAGYARPPEGGRGFVWLPLTGMLPLPPLPGDTESAAYGVNDAGVVVGTSLLPDPFVARYTHVAAVRWDDGVPTDLATLVTNGDGWALTSAVGINQAGVIVGMGTLNGEEHGYLLTPDPPMALNDPPAHAHDQITVARVGR